MTGQNATSGTVGNQPIRTVLFPVKTQQIVRNTTILSAQQQQQPAKTQQVAGTTQIPEQKHVPSAEELEAAKNARYYFSSDVEDQARNLTQHRDELRDGLKVKGSYSYSDGFLKRKVVYEADEKDRKSVV